MNRKIALLVWSTVFTMLVFLGRSVTTQAAPSSTAICGAIASSTWTSAGNPYQVCAGGATLNAGSILDIEPGVVVEFAAGGKLTSRGTLNALGTITQPITFTGAVATPGSWQGLVLESLVVTPTRATFDHTIFRYGGLNNYYGAQLYADDAVVTMTNSLLDDGAGSGLFGASGSWLSIHDTQSNNNGLDAFRLEQPVHAPDLGGLSASGNNRNLVFVDSTTYLTGDQTWPAAGLPFLINAVFGNTQGNSLSIAPGAELRFTTLGYMNIRGDLKAIGLPTAPITLTGETPTPGLWGGLVLYGVTQPATAQLDYVTVEYGGKGISTGANVLVDYGNLVANHSIFRFSSKDGVRVSTGSGAAFMNGQVTGNTQYGVRNLAPTRWVLAANNYWGSPSGPTPDTPACGNGSGDQVTDGVLFRPVLTGTAPVEFPLVDAPSLSLTPRRWFAPADGQTKVYFDIVLRDANGYPLPGRVVNLTTSLGTATSGGITDANGHTLAYLVSNTLGTAEVRAVVANSGCEGALSPMAQVTFQPPLSVVNLFPDARAPYFDGAMSVSPMPVMLGISTTLTTKLTNPLTVPITVDLAFGYVQSSIGLAFGPISQLVGQVIPAQSTREFSAVFVPAVSGHYCVDITYTITGIGTAEGLMLPAAPGGGGRQQTNLNTYPGPTARPSDKDALKKADQAWNIVNKVPVSGVPIQKAITNSWWDKVKDAAEEIAKALGGDPPRQDFDQITLPSFVTWPAVQPGGGVSQARADALNAASDDLAQVVGYGAAASLAMDRYAGASEAGNQTWAAAQANARLEYEQQLGAALLAYADHLDALRQVLINEAEPAVNITVGQVISRQQTLQNTGFPAQEIADAHLAGLTDAQIEAYRQEIIAADPTELAGSLLDKYEAEAEASRQLGAALLTSDTFVPSFSIGGSAGLRPSEVVSNTLAQINTTSATFVLGNPLTQTASIQLRPRRIDLPADWIVSVTPGEVTLAPGEQTTVTVTVQTGSLAAQGSVQRVAVEGYAGSTLLGGVVVDVVVPAFTERFDTYNLFLPALYR